jgi:hypothetical protein
MKVFDLTEPWNLDRRGNILAGMARMRIVCTVGDHWSDMTNEDRQNAQLLLHSRELLEGCVQALQLCEANGYSPKLQAKLRDTIARATEVSHA